MQEHTLAQISFGPWPEDADDSWSEEVEHEFQGLMNSLIRQGQIFGDSTSGIIERELRAFVSLPTRDALEPRYFSKYAAVDHTKLEKRFGQPMKVSLLSPGNVITLDGAWQNSPWLVLMSSMTDGIGVIATPNLEPLPGYTLPLDPDTHEQLYFWARNHQRHEGLWFNGTSLELACLKAMADPLSDLNRQAARLAHEVEQAVGKPVYTALFRYYALPGDEEIQRPCPLCGADWHVEGELFPFRCISCRLLGEIGPSEDENQWARIGTWEERLRRAKYEDWQPASSRSLLGQLQRGRGDAYRSLLNEAPPRAWALIEDCLRHDPRMDRQVESRSWYYGSLIQKTGIPMNRVCRALKEVPEDDTSVLEVIGWLAAQGSKGAADVLEEQIQTGASWDKAAHELAESPEDIAGPRLCRALLQRFSNPQDLANAVQELWHLPSSLFSSLRDHPSQEVQAALCRQENGLVSFRASDEKAALECAEMSLPELVDQADDAAAHVLALIQAAENQVWPHDAQWLWQALDLAQPNRSRVILAALQQIVDETMLPKLLSLTDQIFDTKGYGRFESALTFLFLRLPSRETLPLARLWIHHDSPLRQRIARKLLAAHADASDIPLLRKLLAKGLQNQVQDHYLICDCLEACARFPNIGVLDEVSRAYTELRYDYGRMLAVKALRVLCPDTFREEYAEDCLFDSNEETRNLTTSLN
jgi:predicted  nucleic acid-binding Zn ribbon protein